MIEVKDEQPMNASFPILVTELGIEIEVRFERPLNASFPILVTELGMMVDWHPTISILEAVSIMALQFSRESYFVFSLSTTMEVREEQYENA